MYDKKLFAERLKELRGTLLKTQIQFAEFVGSTPATISAYENGAKNPSLEIVSNIANRCNVSLDWLCGLSDKKDQKKSILTYSDLLHLIYELMEATQEHDLEVELSVDTNTIYSNSKVNIELDDEGPTLRDAIKEFKAVYDLYAAKTITKNMYDTLFESLIKKYDEQLCDSRPPFLI